MAEIIFLVATTLMMAYGAYKLPSDRFVELFEEEKGGKLSTSRIKTFTAAFIAFGLAIYNSMVSIPVDLEWGILLLTYSVGEKTFGKGIEVYERTKGGNGTKKATE